MNNEICNEVANGLLRFVDYFNEHPRSQNMTYGEHYKRSLTLSLKMCLGFIYLLIHSIFPFLFESKGSNIIKELYEDIKDIKDIEDIEDIEDIKDISKKSH